MELDDVAEAFAALGQSTRLGLLRVLLAAGPAGLAAGDAAARLGIPPSTLSFHLRGLEQAGLIAARRQGRHVVYAAQTGRLHGLLGFLAVPHGEDAMRAALDRIADGAEAGRIGPVNVLFLCTRNAARSIMAEAILATLGAGRFAAHSAGSAPAPDGPMPEVLAHLKAHGHDLSGLGAKSWDRFRRADAPAMHVVITLCDTLGGPAAPDFGAATVAAAWPLPDPAKFHGSVVERNTLLNELYAGLRRRVEAFVRLPVASLDRLALKARLDALASPHAIPH